MGIMQKKQQDTLPARRRENALTKEGRASQSSLDERYAFRRNRTLTGSLSPHVSSVNEHHSELKSSRIHAHDLRRHRHKLSTLLAITLFAILLLGYLVYESTAMVTVTAHSLESNESAPYTDSIQQYFAGRPMERFRFALNASMLTEYLQENGHPEIDKIDPAPKFGGFGTTNVQLVFRRPAVVWNTGGSRVYVDDQGNAFTKNHFEEPQITVIDRTGIQAENDRVLVSNRFLTFIGRVIGLMRQHGFEVTEVALPADTTRQIEVKVARIGFPIKYSIDRPAGEQSEDAARALNYIVNRGISVAEYVDVRVSGKAYYK